MLIRYIVRFSRVCLEIVQAHITARRGIVGNVAIGSSPPPAAVDEFPFRSPDAGFLVFQILAEDLSRGRRVKAALIIAKNWMLQYAEALFSMASGRSVVKWFFGGA